jgi:hypothetical protein
MEIDTGVPPELAILYGTQTGNAQEVAEGMLFLSPSPVLRSTDSGE